MNLHLGHEQRNHPNERDELHTLSIARCGQGACQPLVTGVRSLFMPMRSALSRLIWPMVCFRRREDWTGTVADGHELGA